TAETSTADGATTGAGLEAELGERASRTGGSGLARCGDRPPRSVGGVAPAAMLGAGGTMLGAAATVGSEISTPRAEGRVPALPLSASVTRASSATTAPRPIRMRPPVSAVLPVVMSVVPRVNSLIGMPNPIAATPAAATTIPSKVKITDMRRPPALNGDMVTKEFWPRSASTATPNMTWLRPNPIVLNTCEGVHTYEWEFPPLPRTPRRPRPCPVPSEPGHALELLRGACSCRRAGIHFAGTCANELTRNRGQHA